VAWANASEHISPAADSNAADKIDRRSLARPCELRFIL
jgi:hypothetical protein